MTDAETGAAFRNFCAEVTRDRLAQPKRRTMRRLSSTDNLPMPRVEMRGPRWRKHFDVRELPIAEVHPEAAKYHRPGRKLLVFTLEDDVRERILEELRPGIYAQWSDVRERWPTFFVEPRPKTCKLLRTPSGQNRANR